MSANTSIEWTDATWNPIRARDRKTGKVGHYCELISPGCAHCYAAAFQPRFGLPQYAGAPQREARFEDLELFLDSAVLAAPLRWRRPRRVFVCSMTDLFGEWVLDAWIDRCFAVMALTPQHTHQVLTKRPERMRDYLTTAGVHNRLELAADALFPGSGHPSFGGKHMLPSLPLRNVWAGVSVENQEETWRIGCLLQTLAAVRFVSAEPLLEAVSLTGLMNSRRGYFAKVDSLECAGKTYPKRANIDWLIIGGESGPRARPCNVAWVRSLVQQCRAAGVPAFVKQLGRRPMIDAPAHGYMAQDQRQQLPLELHDPKGGDMSEFPDDLRVREFPKVPA